MDSREVGLQKGVPSNQSYDPDTINTIQVDLYNGEGCYGRKNIIINASYEDFISSPFEVIKENLHYILATHKQNCTEMEYLHNFFKGKQDILKKTRANSDDTINNKHVSNLAWEYVNFKKGYYVGKPLKYVDLNTEENSQMKYFTRYLRETKKSSKDLIKYENMFITGIAHTMIIPKKVAYNNEYESPYTYTVLNNNDVCVVKANDIFKTKLFSMCFSRIKGLNGESDYYIYTIYFANKVLKISNKSGDIELLEEATMPIEDCITEYQLNEQRMGVFEPVLIALNTINKISSDQLDQFEENINSYLTFENVDVSSIVNNIGEFRKNRILVVSTNNPETPAKIGSVNVPVEQTPINNKLLELKQETYDIVGVPMPTSSTGQGVSGEAQVYGGGWENAQTIAHVDTQYILQYEYEDLYKMIKIANNGVGSKLTSLIPTDIEIKYTINKSNNMMVKAQSMKYFVDEGFTREQALTFCEITDDPQNEGKIADENYEKQIIRTMELELEKSKQQKQINSEEKPTE